MRTDITIHSHERLDDLHRNGHHIIQDPKRFCFGVDAVILAGFAKVKKGEKVLDLGTVRVLSRFCLPQRQRENGSRDWKYSRKVQRWQTAVFF